MLRSGSIATYDAVLTAFLVGGHFWNEWSAADAEARRAWDRRAEVVIPRSSEASTVSASRLFAATYPEAIELAAILASPAWRALAFGDAATQRRFIAEIGRRLGRPHYQPPDHGDAIAHWMKFDSWRAPSQPTMTFRDTRWYGSSHIPTTAAQSKDRQQRSAVWFARNRQGGSAILHHRHVRSVLVRQWAPQMDGVVATVWASRTTEGASHRPTVNFDCKA
ncbi:MAG: hypothetical protein JWR11_3394 [Mycobacterium sp.]|nr:hypothetical protein [Mycobacterium sp.]